MEKNLSKELQESLKRHRELLGYNPTKGTTSLNEIRDRHSYLADNTDYAEGDEEENEGGDEEGGDNPDFDFGGTEGDEGEDIEATDEGGDETEGFGDEGAEGEEEEADEFGTADEFSAADDIESEEDSDTEEIDVTDIVKRADDAKGYAEKAVTAAEEGKNMISDLMSKFEALQTSLSKIDTVSNEIQSMKKDIQSQRPKEKLELRSLDSYPFNVKLTDYWNDEKIKSNYEINGGTPDAESQDGEVKVWKLDPNDAKDYSNVDIKKSFVPESKSKKKVLTENEHKYCGECGNKLDVNDTFCDECGIKQETNKNIGKKYFNGKLSIEPIGAGSKSEGLRAYLEDSGKKYILYKKGEYEGNVSYFEPFKGKNVSVSGELQKDKYIMVKDIQFIK